MASGIAVLPEVRDITDETDLIIACAEPRFSAFESTKDESLACAFDALLTVFDTE